MPKIRKWINTIQNLKSEIEYWDQQDRELWDARSSQLSGDRDSDREAAEDDRILDQREKKAQETIMAMVEPEIKAACQLALDEFAYLEDANQKAAEAIATLKKIVGAST